MRVQIGFGLWFLGVVLGCGPLDDPLSEAPHCEEVVRQVDVAPLRRLTESELRNALAFVFPDVERPTFSLAKGRSLDGYENDHQVLQANELVVEQIQSLAYEMSLLVTEVESEDSIQAWLDARLERAFRRPITSLEGSQWSGWRIELESTYEPPVVRGLLTQALIQSPAFLYRFEFGVEDGSAAGIQQLDDFSIANRLSFLLWQAPPDALLWADADAGLLQDSSVRVGHVRRMLADPRSEEPIQDFVGQWLGLNELPSLEKDLELYPEFSPEIWEMMKEETKRFTSDVLVKQGATYDDLMVENASWVTPELADLYGVSHPDGEGWSLVELPLEERAGLLTQASFLAGRSNQINPNPVLRSAHILERVLCCEPNPPPESIDTSVTDSEQLEGPTTNRDRFEAKTSEGYCASCHTRLNPLGFAYEHYDAVGRYRTHDHGFPVDSSGGIQLALRDEDPFALCKNSVALDADGDAQDAIDMSTLIAGSDAYGQCFVQQFTRFATGTAVTEEGECVSQQVYASAQERGRTLEGILLEWVESPFFTQRIWESN